LSHLKTCEEIARTTLKSHVRMRDKMNQVEIGVQPPATIHAFQLAETVSEARRETVNKICANKPIQFLEPRCDKWIMDSRQWCRGSEVGSNTEIGNFAEQHHGLDKQQERIRVLFWMTCKNIRGEETLGIVCNGLLQTRSGKCSPRCRNPSRTLFSKSWLRRGSSVPMSRSSMPWTHPPTDTMRSKSTAIHQVRRRSSKSNASLGGAR
jgi:hypothetical protein